MNQHGAICDKVLCTFLTNYHSLRKVIAVGSCVYPVRAAGYLQYLQRRQLPEHFCIVSQLRRGGAFKNHPFQGRAVQEAVVIVYIYSSPKQCHLSSYDYACNLFEFCKCRVSQVCNFIRNDKLSFYSCAAPECTISNRFQVFRQFQPC